MKKYITIVFAVQLMRSSLITILLSSEKRTDLLLFLKDKPRTIEEINCELDTNSVAILPQLKRLKENGLVVQEDRVYSLSLLGKILVRRMESLVKAFRLLEDNYDYWSGVQPGGVPPAFFKLMEELMAHIPDTFQAENSSFEYKEVTEAICSSKQLLLIISHPDPRYFGICAEHAKKGLKLSVIMTRVIFENFASEFQEELYALHCLENSDIFVLGKDITPPTVAVADRMVLTLFSQGQNNGTENSGLVIFGEKAVCKGQEIFEYFKALATPLAPGKSDQVFFPDHMGDFR